jgi:disulfide bond formation protein DsbB
MSTDIQAAPPPPVAPPTVPAPGEWAVVNFFVAILALAGSLYLSLGMGLKACPLCLYQRTFVMGVVGVLGVGLLAKVKPVGSLALLSLPLAVAGFTVGVFHVYLEYIGKLECPPGIGGMGSAPQQALVIQALLFLLLLVDAVRTRGLLPALGSVLLGAVFAVAAIRSAPPAPPTPYPPPALDGCRPPPRPPSA